MDRGALRASPCDGKESDTTEQTLTLCQRAGIQMKVGLCKWTQDAV